MAFGWGQSVSIQFMRMKINISAALEYAYGMSECDTGGGCEKCVVLFFKWFFFSGQEKELNEVSCEKFYKWFLGVTSE